MSIEVKMMFEGSYNTWEFKVNEEGYIDTKINGLYSDTLYDMGEVKGDDHLESVVKHLLKCWGVAYKDLKIYA